MYVPTHFEETRVDVLHDLIRAHPLGALVTLSASGLDANHIPFEVDPDPGPFGTLRGHVARANPVWREFSSAVDALVIFRAAGAYISPSWYPTKQATGKVVPTWNYVTVHAWGQPQAIQDVAWLRRQVDDPTLLKEGGRTDPWAVADAPEDFVAMQLKGIVGIEIPIARIEGKWKVSQNRPEADRRGVAEGLRFAGDAASEAMAELVEARGLPADR